MKKYAVFPDGDNDFHFIVEYDDATRTDGGWKLKNPRVIYNNGFLEKDYIEYRIHRGFNSGYIWGPQNIIEWIFRK
jgi:hypothetical protein